MTEHQRLFLVQARTDFEVFRVFRNQEPSYQCHALHYLQMATELLGKAYAWRDGPRPRSHRAFVPFLRSLSTSPKARNQLGYSEKNEQWKQLLRKCIPLAERIEKLAPALAGDGPNPEYPWPPNAPIKSPVEFEFAVWEELQNPTYGRQFLDLLTKLFGIAEAYI